MPDWFKPSLRQARRCVLACLLLLPLAAMADGQTIPSKGVLWELKAGGHTAYLFGSIHLAKPDFYPLAPAVEAAYRAAQVVAVEVDVTDQAAQARAMPLFTYAAPDKLEQHLTPATWQALRGVLGISTEQFQVLKPAVIVSALVVGVMQGQGYTPQAGIDLHFIRRAKADHKTLRELETLTFQAQVLTDFSDAEGDQMLSTTLDSLKNGEMLNLIGQMVRAWQDGDAVALEKILQQTAQQDASTAKLMRRLLDERNPAMAEKILSLLTSDQPALVVVGAGHMTGANSIVKLLQKQGVQVRLLP